MSPVVAAIVVAATTTLGRWARGKDMTVDIVVGLMGIAIALTIIDQINKELAKAFGVLAVVATMVGHADVIFKVISGVTGGGTNSGGGGGSIAPEFH